MHACMHESTTREKPSISAGFWPISSAGAIATALQLKVSSSVGLHALLLYVLSSSAVYIMRYW